MNVTTQTSSGFQEVDTGAIRHGAIVDGRAQKLGRRRVAQLDISTDHAVADVPSEESALTSFMMKKFRTFVTKDTKKVIELGSKFYEDNKESIDLNYIENFKEIIRNSRNEILNIWFEAAMKPMKLEEDDLTKAIKDVREKNAKEKKELEERLQRRRDDMYNLKRDRMTKVEFEAAEKKAKRKHDDIIKEINDASEKNTKEKEELDQKLKQVQAKMKRLEFAKAVEHAETATAKTKVLEDKKKFFAEAIEDVLEKEDKEKEELDQKRKFAETEKAANRGQTEIQLNKTKKTNKNYKKLLEKILGEVCAEMAKLELEVAEKDVEDLNNEIAGAKNAKEKETLRKKLEEAEQRLLALERCNC